MIIDRDLKRPEIFRLAGSEYTVVVPNTDGWLPSESMGVRFRVVQGPPPRLSVEDALDPSMTTLI